MEQVLLKRGNVEKLWKQKDVEELILRGWSLARPLTDVIEISQPIVNKRKNK